MRLKTLYMFLLSLSICLGCAAEIEYWKKQMEASKKEKGSSEGKPTEGTKQAVVTTPPPPPAPTQPPVSWPPVEWPPREQPASQPAVAPATPEAPVAPTSTGFTISVKGGDKYIGEIMHETIAFKTEHGTINVKPDNLVSFAQGGIKMQDGTNVKGTIGQSTVKIKTTGLGELEIKAGDIESITK